MRRYTFAASRSHSSHSLLKALLLQVGFEPGVVRERLAMRFLYPLDDRYEVPKNEINMSDGADFADQIRFFLVERSRRHFRLLAERIVNRVGPVRVEVYNAHALDEGSQDFARTIARSGIALQVVLMPGDASEDGSEALSCQLTPQEREVAALVQRVSQLTPEQRSLVRTAAEQYLNVGDGWTSVPLCMRLLEDGPEPELHFMTGMGLLLLGRTLEAETYYLRWREDGPRHRARANYTLAMLYARHNPKHLLSLDRAEAYLEEAYEILKEVPADDPQRTFQQVFNRNGLALIEYKRGQIDQAVERVQNGIARLMAETPREALHKVVLIYNVALCYQTLGRWQETRATFEQLLEHDPLMADYHLELARVLLTLGEIDAAQASIDTALELDEAISEGYSLRGYAFLQEDRTTEAIEAFRRAFHLDQTSGPFAYDLSYALNGIGQHKEAEDVLNTHVRHVGATVLSADAWSLRAEIASYTQDLPAARDLLRQGLQVHPASGDLAENLTLVETELSNTKA